MLFARTIQLRHAVHAVHHRTAQFATPEGEQLNNRLNHHYGMPPSVPVTIAEIMDLALTGKIIPNDGNIFGYSERLNSVSLSTSDVTLSATKLYEDEQVHTERMRKPNAYNKSNMVREGRVYLPWPGDAPWDM